MVNDKSFDEWDYIFLGPIDSIYTQSLWHAAALLISKGELERNILTINWPTYPIVSCGFHQIASQVIDLEYCSQNEIPVIRRAVGGGAVYLDSNQLFYQFIWHKDTPNIPRRVSEIFKTLLNPITQTYRDFGVDALYKPVNDILANNKKISGNGAGMIDSAQVLVGNFILDFPRQEMARILRVPDEKFRDKVYKSLKEGISSFKDELGFIPSREEIISTLKINIEEFLGIELASSKLNLKIESEMKRLKTMYLTKEWLDETEIRGKNLFDAVKIHGSMNVAQGMYKSQGGLIKALCEFQSSRLTDILISGDFWITPNKLPELEETLRGLDLDKDNITREIQEFLNKEACETSGTTAADIAQSIQVAYTKTRR